MKEYKLKSSPLAKAQIRQLHIYYEITFGRRKADKIFKSIEEALETLRIFPGLGVQEPLLSGYPQCFRSFVQHPNVKVIYWVEDDAVKIALLFHTRQAPEKLRYTIEGRTDWVCEELPPYGARK